MCSVRPLAISVLIVVLAALMQSSALAAPEAPSSASEPTLPLPAAGPEAHQPALAPNCRYGADVLADDQTSWLPDLGVGWFSNFSAVRPASPANLQFAFTIAVGQDKDGCQYLGSYTVSPSLTEWGLGQAVRANPGALWLVGNEPDRGPNPGDCLERVQDDTYPQMYARIYHDVYHFIKQHDNTAQVAVAGLVQVTPGRLQYWDIVEATYRQLYGTKMPVDVWNMHLYILPERQPDGAPNGTANVALGTDLALGMIESGGRKENCGNPNGNVYCWADHDNMTLFRQQVERIRGWMKTNGEQNKPLIVSEYSLLYPFEDYDSPTNPSRCYMMDEFGHCFTQERVVNFVNASFSYFESAADPALGYPLDRNRLVQKWMWFSVYAPVPPNPVAGYVSNLTTSDSLSLSWPGAAFRAAVAAQALQINLFPESPAPSTAGFAYGPTGRAGVRITVAVRNNGNSATGTPTTVSFYRDSGLTDVIGSAVIPAGLGGCAMAVARVSVAWTDLKVGTYTFWAKVDSGGLIGETDEGDNVTTGTVVIYPYGLSLPLIVR